jgi:hypothetical protein
MIGLLLLSAASATRVERFATNIIIGNGIVRSVTDVEKHVCILTIGVKIVRNARIVGRLVFILTNGLAIAFRSVKAVKKLVKERMIGMDVFV